MSEWVGICLDIFTAFTQVIPSFFFVDKWDEATYLQAQHSRDVTTSQGHGLIS